MKEFIVLKPKTYCLKNRAPKEKVIEKENSGKLEDYKNALIHVKETTVEESR